MKIGIDISQIAYEGTGVARFTSGLLHAILSYEKKHEWTFFYSSFRKPFNTLLKQRIISSHHRLVEIRIPPSLLSFVWNTLHIIPIESFVGSQDLFISSDWTQPPSLCKKATIVHDLAYVRYPETIHPYILKTQRQRMYWVMKEVNEIIADSESTKSDLITYLKRSEKSITVIYPGVEKFTNEITKQNKTLIFNKPYILTVGKIEPRKNIKRLLQAYQAIPKDKNTPDLVVVGQFGWEDKPGIEQYLSDRIHILGHINDMELSELFRNCLFFIYPSLWEGFGYPVVEAMLYGVPVATSNTSSLQEIGKDAALLFDPTNVESIRDAIQNLIQNKNLCMDLQKKGTIKAQNYTWSKYIKTLSDRIIK